MFQLLLERIAVEFDRRSIPYLIIGGQAVLVHGEPRLTRDIDITLGIDIDRLDELLDISTAAGWKVLVDAPLDFVTKTMVLPCEAGEHGIRLDFIFSRLPYERAAMQRATLVKIGAADVRFASPEDLVIHKMVAGRPRDIEDIRSVLLRNPEIDNAYVRQWLTDLGTAINEPLIDRYAELSAQITK